MQSQSSHSLLTPVQFPASLPPNMNDEELSRLLSFFGINTYWGESSWEFKKAVKKVHLVMHRSAEYDCNSRAVMYKCRHRQTQSCPFYLRLGIKRLKNPSGWYVTNFINHTCTPDPNSSFPPTSASLSRTKVVTGPQKRRMTSIGTALMAEMLTPIISDVTTVTNSQISALIGGNASQSPRLIPANKMANRAYRKTVAARIKQRFMQGDVTQPLPTSQQDQTSYLRGLRSFSMRIKEVHPKNQIIIHTKDTPTAGRVYDGSFLLLGPVIEMAERTNSTYQFDFDGSHFKMPRYQFKLEGFIKTVVYIDANGSYFPFMIAHDIEEENKENWNRFLQTFWTVCPTASTSASGCGSDRDGGLIGQAMLRFQSQPAEERPAWVHCVKHIERKSFRTSGTLPLKFAVDT